MLVTARRPRRASTSLWPDASRLPLASEKVFPPTTQPWLGERSSKCVGEFVRQLVAVVVNPNATSQGAEPPATGSSTDCAPSCVLKVSACQGTLSACGLDSSPLTFWITPQCEGVRAMHREPSRRSLQSRSSRDRWRCRRRVKTDPLRRSKSAGGGVRGDVDPRSTIGIERGEGKVGFRGEMGRAAGSTRPGVSIKEHARRPGLSRNTIRAALRASEPPGYRRVPRGSKLDPFKTRSTACCART